MLNIGGGEPVVTGTLHPMEADIGPYTIGDVRWLRAREIAVGSHASDPGSSEWMTVTS